MFYSQVLTGDFTTGQAGLRFPPFKNRETNDVYDSVCDNLENPSMFVIFSDIQAYPEYLVIFGSSLVNFYKPICWLYESENRKS